MLGLNGLAWGSLAIYGGDEGGYKYLVFVFLMPIVVRFRTHWRTDAEGVKGLIGPPTTRDDAGGAGKREAP